MANVYVNHDDNAAFAVATLYLIANVDVRILIQSFDDSSALFDGKRIKDRYFSMRLNVE